MREGVAFFEFERKRLKDGELNNFNFRLSHYFCGVLFCIFLPFVDFVKFIDNVSDIEIIRAKIVSFKEETVRTKRGLTNIYYPIYSINFKNKNYQYIEYVSSRGKIGEQFTFLVTNNSN